MNITICGAGNAAQTLIALLAADRETQVTVFAPLADEAALLSAASAPEGLAVTFAGGETAVGRPQRVTTDPRSAAQDADLVLLALPAFAHESILRALAPNLRPAVWIGALPARGGFDWMARAVLGLTDEASPTVLFGLQTLPWACRIQSWGRRVEVLGTKAEVDLAAWPATCAGTIAEVVQRLIGVNVRTVPSFLALTLANTGQIIHPGIMYGLFHAWDGLPFTADATPAFYGGVDDETAAVLQALSDEVQTICRALERTNPELDLSSVDTLIGWLLRSYAGQIHDPSTLRSAFNTNRAYAGLRAPMMRSGEGYSPAFDSRYLSEDVPYGLLVTRGIGELAGVATPAIDNVIMWAQEKLGRQYLTVGGVGGNDLQGTRAPQRFGFNSAACL